jgi:hypothetical protein
MPCTARHQKNRRRTRGRLLCFECYRTRLDRPEQVPMLVQPFPRILTPADVEHRRRMLKHLEGGRHADLCNAAQVHR